MFDLVHEPLRRFVRRRADPAYVDDVVADTLLVVWRRLDDVPVGQELPWCYGVARRCLANQRRSESRRLGLVDRLTEHAQVSAADDHAYDDPTRAALEALAEEDRTVLQLWAWEGLAPRELAAVLGITANAASIRLHRAKRRLKAALESGKDRPPAGHESGGRIKEQP